jgi:hypothetical protein
MAKRAKSGRVRGAVAPILLGLLAASACSNDFDATRTFPARPTLGAELFGVVCDRVGGQSLHEDLSGDSYRALCHGENGDGVFGADSFHVNQAALPSIAGDRPNVDGGVVSASQQDTDRAYGVARLERLAQDRARLIAALDATFPPVDVPIKNLGAADPTQSCQADPAGQGSLHTELANLLARFTALYDDGTIPRSTAALGAVAQSLRQSAGGQSSWAHFNSRAGYRPFDLAVGAIRPTIAYKDLRSFVNATVKLLSPDSNPYDPAPKFDSTGKRIPTPGAAYAAMSQLSAAVHADFANETPDPTPSPLVLAKAVDAADGATVLNRPMTDLETLQSLLFAEDPTFGSAPFASGATGLNAPHYIVERDPRGYAAVVSTKGALPAPFMLGADGLPEVDSVGRFMTSGGQAAPTPFALNPTDMRSRDVFGRALGSTGQPIYGYVDTSQSYLSALLGHLQGAVSGTSLLDSKAADNHESLMGTLAGAYVLFGPRASAPLLTTRTYADGTKLAYSGYASVGSPLGDLIYAFGQLLADPTLDPTLSLTSTLITKNTADIARVIGDTLYAKAQADKHPEAKIPATSTFWDEIIDLVVQIAQDKSAAGTGQTRLLEDILTAFAAPASAGLSKGLASQAGNLDVITYDRNNLNGPAVNTTTKDPTSPPATAPDPTKPDASANRSELQRFAQLVHDTNGVTLCNKEGAILHAADLPIFNTSNACASTAGNNGELCLSPDTTCTCNNSRPFHECEMLKVNNLAGFYLDSIAGKASLYFRNKLVREGIGSAPGGTGATSVAVTEASSQIGLHPAATSAMPAPTPDDTYNGPTNMDPAAPGFWDPVATVWNPTLTPPTLLRPKPGWINRQIEFDLVNDSPMTGPNQTTNQFLQGLQGLDIGTSVCPERLIPDPCKTDAKCFDSMADNDVAADGMVHGLRSCPDGDWLYQRDPDTLFTWEENGFLSALQPLATAFASHGREDLFIQLMEVLHKHWQTAAGAAASPGECKLTTDANGKTTTCSKDGTDTYEPLLTTIFASDLLTALNSITSVAQGISVPTCSAIDPTKHTCTTPGPTLSGIGVLAAAARDLVDPVLAASYKLKDSTGNATAPRNDGSTNPQVTPIYLVLDALDEIDAALAADAASAQEPDKNRLAEWRLGRSQLVDELLTVNGENTAKQSFADPSFAKVAPVLIDTLRSQLLAQCGSDEITGKCAWARGVTPAASCPPGMVAGTGATSGCVVPRALWNEMVASAGSPLFAGAMDVTDAIRRDPTGRASLEDLLVYLGDAKQTDAAGQVESLTEFLSTSHDLLQVLRDDTNLVPIYKVFAAAFAPPPDNPQGPSVIDATTALLTRLAGHAFDGGGNEICSKEIDPNNVLDLALAHLVTPMPTGADASAGAGSPGITPLEIIVDTVADVNRASPSDGIDPLQPADYANISNELGEFLTDPERGIEQFYAIVRNATEPR